MLSIDGTNMWTLFKNTGTFLTADKFSSCYIFSENILSRKAMYIYSYVPVGGHWKHRWNWKVNNI